MKERLIVIVKSSKIIYLIYYYAGKAFLNLLKIFVPFDKKTILINSFGGKKYDDSPKAIYDKMIKDSFFNDFKFVWAFHNPENFNVPIGEKIRTDTLKYYITALKAGVWITNSGIERGLSFKRKKTLYLNTWHGSPIKKMGSDIGTDKKSFKSKGKNSIDLICAQSDFEAETFSRVFSIDENKFIRCGLPRNDVLASHTTEDTLAVREKLGIKPDAKVILYAPTFREFKRDQQKNVVCEFPFDMAKWKQLGEDYIILFRAHYEVSKFMNLPKNDKNLIDVSSYPVLNDLMIAADILVSDYSSLIFDFSITEKPVVLFTYDYKEYEKERGMYFDIREYFQNATNEAELLGILKNIDCKLSANKTKKFKEKYLQYYGNAAEECIKALKEKVS